MILLSYTDRPLVYFRSVVKKYDKYIIWRLAGAMLLICLSLTAIAWLSQSLRFIDLIVNRGLNVSTFLYLSTLILPALLWVIVPISLFVSVVFVYNRLANDSELVVLKNAGISRFGIARPVLIFAFLATAFSYLIALYLMPASYREFKDLQSFIRDNYASLLLQEGVFATPTDGVTVYIRERSNDGVLRGILVDDSRDPQKAITMMAQEGALVQSDNGPRFLLVSGNRQEFNKETREFSILYFERYSLELALFAQKDGFTRWREPRERYFHELFFPKDTIEETQLQKLRAEGHHRLSWPLYNILLAMVGVIIFITGEFNRRGQGRRIIAGVVAAILLIIWSFGINWTVVRNASLVPLIHITTIGGAILLIYMIITERRFFRGGAGKNKLADMNGSA